MILHDQIAKAYIEGDNLEQFRKEWYFSNSDLSREYGKNVFTLPSTKRRPGNRQAGSIPPSCQSFRASLSPVLPQWSFMTACFPIGRKP